jgi:chloramphenicol O-acetyltransferase
MMGFSFEVNHRFIDGADIGRFSAELEKLMSEL